MRRLGATVAAAAFALLAVACGQQEEVGFGGSPATNPAAEKPQSSDPLPPTELPNPMDPAPPPGAQSVSPAKVDASGLPEGYPKVAWTEGDGRTVGAYGVASGGCVEVRGELAEQNAQRVVLRIIEHTTSSGPCTMEIRYPPVTVELAEALGERTIVLQRTATS